jgi:hypothetical protein
MAKVETALVARNVKNEIHLHRQCVGWRRAGTNRRTGKKANALFRKFGDDREVVLMNDSLIAILETPRAFSDEEIQMAKNALIMAAKTKFRKAEISKMEVVDE